MAFPFVWSKSFRSRKAWFSPQSRKKRQLLKHKHQNVMPFSFCLRRIRFRGQIRQIRAVFLQLVTDCPDYNKTPTQNLPCLRCFDLPIFMITIVVIFSDFFTILYNDAFCNGAEAVEARTRLARHSLISSKGEEKKRTTKWEMTFSFSEWFLFFYARFNSQTTLKHKFLYVLFQPGGGYSHKFRIGVCRQGS